MLASVETVLSALEEARDHWLFGLDAVGPKLEDFTAPWFTDKTIVFLRVLLTALFCIPVVVLMVTFEMILDSGYKSIAERWVFR